MGMELHSKVDVEGKRIQRRGKSFSHLKHGLEPRFKVVGHIILLFFVLLLTTTSSPHDQDDNHRHRHKRGSPDMPERPSYTSLRATEINVSWYAPFPGKCEITKYELSKWDPLDPGWGENNSISDTTFYLMKELQPFTTYYFKVRAENCHGWGAYSSESLPMTTLRKKPTIIPTVKSWTTSSTTVNIEIEKHQNGSLHGEFDRWEICVRQIGLDLIPEWRKLTLSDQDEKTFIIDNLRPSSNYNVTIHVCNGWHCGSPTCVNVTTTNEGETATTTTTVSTATRITENIEPNSSANSVARHLIVIFICLCRRHLD